MPQKIKKTMKLDLSVWYNERTDHIHFSGRSGAYNFISTVNNKPGSKRCHPHLFNHLKQALKEHSLWPRN